MLSTKPIKQSGQASQYYFDNSNYYFNEQGAKENSQWYGQGAERLNLTGEVEQDKFTELLQGRLPNGQQLGKKVGDTLHHRAGYDLTFNAPKSVSMMLLLAGDERILAAHDKAVATTLNLIEKNCAQARKTERGITYFENTNNLTVACFRQYTSRANDPHLHTHCAVLNMTQRGDLKWRALASDCKNSTGDGVQGFWERIREQQRYLGGIYRAELAYELKQLGYDIVKTGQGHCFEIAGVPQAALEEFGQRRKAIEAYMKAKGWEGAKAASEATLRTRASKIITNSEELKNSWQARSARVGFQTEKVYQASLNPSSTKTIDTSTPAQQKIASEAIDYAIDVLSEWQVSCYQLHLLSMAMEYSDEPIDVMTLWQAIDNKVASGELIPLNRNQDNQRFTTKALIAREQALVQFALSGKDHSALFESHQVKVVVDKQLQLTSSQRLALQSLLTRPHRVQLIEGPTQSGKTQLLTTLATIAKEQRQHVIGLAATQAASRELASQLNVSCYTVQRFVSQLYCARA